VSVLATSVRFCGGTGRCRCRFNLDGFNFLFSGGCFSNSFRRRSFLRNCFGNFFNEGRNCRRFDLNRARNRGHCVLSRSFDRNFGDRDRLGRFRANDWRHGMLGGDALRRYHSRLAHFLGRLRRRRRSNRRFGDKSLRRSDDRLGGRDRGLGRNGSGRMSTLTLFRECLEHVAGLGDLRQVDLRFEFVGRPRLAAGAAFSDVAEVLAHLLGFIGFERTGMRLLLGNAHFFQAFENFPALDFQFPSQIVDSRLHPTIISSVPTGSQPFIQTSRRWNLWSPCTA